MIHLHHESLPDGDKEKQCYDKYEELVRAKKPVNNQEWKSDGLVCNFFF
jgi:hypothetical protein